MTCDHEWRNWPWSEDVHCLKCGYAIINGVHMPCGNPEWMRPMPGKVFRAEHKGVAYLVPEAAREALLEALSK